MPGAELDGVVTLDGMDDARGIVARCGKGKVAVVVGGGITALEIVEGLRARGVHVHYFMRKDRYWSNVLSESESRIVELALQREGVEIHTFTDLAAIRGRGGRVAAVETGGGDVIRCDLVAAAVGVRPRVELARAAGLPCDRGILVDEYLRAGDPDIYAAGDIAEAADRHGHPTLQVLWNPALLKGRVAGLNMATDPVHVYEQDEPINVTRLAGLRTTIIGLVGSGTDADLEGLSRGDSEVWSELGDQAIVEAQRGDAHIRLTLGEHTIAGAVVMGDQALSYPLQDLIEGHVDVTGAVAALEEPGGAHRGARQRASGRTGRPAAPGRRRRRGREPHDERREAGRRRRSTAAGRRPRGPPAAAASSGTRSRPIVAVTALYAVAYTQAGAFPTASSWVGHGIGIAGFVLMLMTATLYSLRKLRKDASWGSTASWLRVPHGDRPGGPVHGAAAHGDAVPGHRRADDAADRPRRGQRPGGPVPVHAGAALAGGGGAAARLRHVAPGPPAADVGAVRRRDRARRRGPLLRDAAAVTGVTG